MAKKRVPSGRPPSRAVQPPPTDGRPRNRLLAALPADDFERLRPHLTTIPVRAKQVLLKQGEPIEHVFFPNGGVWSVTTVLSSGAMVEAATIGDEGLLGIEAFLATDAISPGETLMQVPDTNAERMTVSDFRRVLAEPGPFRELIGRYTLVVIAQMMQSAACNVLHQVRQRCARWLLMTHDRMHQQPFRLSHEFLAVMLGVQRPTVSLVRSRCNTPGSSITCMAESP